MQPQTPNDTAPVDPAAPSQPEQVDASQAQAPAVPSAAPSLPKMPPLQPAKAKADVATTTLTGAPAMADDGDLIEKEWVSKVKQIMRATQGNPYEKSKQFTSLKADYMQKRYGKSLKTDN